MQQNFSMAVKPKCKIPFDDFSYSVISCGEISGHGKKYLFLYHVCMEGYAMKGSMREKIEPSHYIVNMIMVNFHHMSPF